MEQKEFDVVIKSRFEKTVKVLSHKAKEYARGDRLSNFKKAAAAMSCSPEKACTAFWMKHVISINDLVNDLESGHNVSVGMWEEKIGDSVNYLILLEALLVERLKG